MFIQETHSNDMTDTRTTHRDQKRDLLKHTRFAKLEANMTKSSIAIFPHTVTHRTSRACGLEHCRETVNRTRISTTHYKKKKDEKVDTYNGLRVSVAPEQVLHDSGRLAISQSIGQWLSSSTRLSALMKDTWDAGGPRRETLSER